MKEDLGLYGNELNYFSTYFNIGYCIMLIPSQIILTPSDLATVTIQHVRPSYWPPGLELIWGILTGVVATANNATQIYAIRIFIGLCESSAWPGMMTLFMHWYTPTELAKRMGFYHSCQGIGNLLANALQTAVHETLNGRNGLAGWRWMFIINAIMTVAVAFLGFFMLPDLPNDPNPRAFWFRRDHGEMAMERLKRHHRAEPRPINWAAISSWIVYFSIVLYSAIVLAAWGYTYFSLFLKSLKKPDGTSVWSVSAINAIPMGGQAIQVLFVWIWAFASDYFKNRHWLIVIQAVIGLVPCVIMSIWNVPLGAKYFSYFFSYLCLGTGPIIIAWVSDMLPQDSEQRALVVDVTIAVYYAIGAWSQVLIWPAKQAPHYKFAWQTSIGLWILVIALTFVLRWVDLKYLLPDREAFRKKLDEEGHASGNEKLGTSA
ncbi:hypothetical protein V5O48_006875 [Marasmius crinis-equi]|uniref:Major facilitator superfamily (MFS) profile domain-containing protein n=1 Tax=Marasmius crinis-equi TaxID=585013 RepID=A0ABR3FIB0_9AGAR